MYSHFFVVFLLSHYSIKIRIISNYHLINLCFFNTNILIGYSCLCIFIFCSSIQHLFVFVQNFYYFSYDFVSKIPDLLIIIFKCSYLFIYLTLVKVILGCYLTFGKMFAFFSVQFQRKSLFYLFYLLSHLSLTFEPKYPTTQWIGDRKL